MEREFRQVVEQAGLDGGRLLLGISGGVDSVVLLDLLTVLAPVFNLQLRVFHLDHCMRAESHADAAFVEELCSRLDIPCHVARVDVPKLAEERGVSLETTGRDVRRGKMEQLAAEQGCRRIVLGHHRDDQAETFLQRLLRGSGLSGLQAMRADDGLYWRPLLDFSRARIDAYARQRQLVWVEDRSNADPQFLRNRLRHQLLPHLTEYNPRIVERLASLSRQLQREEDYWQRLLNEHWPRLEQEEQDGLRLDCAYLRGCHPALQLRLLREALRRLRGELAGIEAVHLEALRELLDAAAPQGELNLPGCWAARRYDSLWLRDAPPCIEPFQRTLVPGVPLSLPDGRHLLAEYTAFARGESLYQTEFDAGALGGELEIRSLQPGDRFVPSGMEGQRKIKDFLIDLKLEKEARQKLPLLVCDGEILWLVGLRRSNRARVMEGSREILSVRLFEGDV